MLTTPHRETLPCYETFTFASGIILSVVLYGCETWSLALREEHILRVSEDRVLRRILGPMRDEVTGSGVKYIMRSLMICTVHQYYSCDQAKKNEMGGARSTYGREERCIQDFDGET